MRNIIEKLTIVDFEKKTISRKFRGHCHLTSNYRGHAHNNCNNNVTQKQSNFIPFVLNFFQ